MTTAKSDSKWTLIIIDDPACLLGKSLFDLMQLLLKIKNFQFVILDYIEGSGKDWVISSLQKRQGEVLKIDDFLKILLDVHQFDWGDFFLFEDYPTYWKHPKGEAYPYMIAQTNTTVRAVDNQYLYIYTPYQEVVDLIKKNYQTESTKIDFLDRLDYPE